MKKTKAKNKKIKKRVKKSPKGLLFHVGNLFIVLSGYPIFSLNGKLATQEISLNQSRFRYKILHSPFEMELQ